LDYNYPLPLQAPFALNYLEYVRSRLKRGEACERLQAGKLDQIRLVACRSEFVSTGQTASFGRGSTGAGDQTRRHFPGLQSLREED